MQKIKIHAASLSVMLIAIAGGCSGVRESEEVSPSSWTEAERRAYGVEPASAVPIDGEYAKYVVAGTTGPAAVHIGEKAKHAAHVAKTASIVGGSMAIVDGLITGYQGFKEIEAVEGAMKVVSSKLQPVAEEENSQTFDLAKKDYEQVTPILLKLAQHAETTVTIGGVKVGCGALTLGSAFMSGPVAPIVAGAVGSACYLGTAIYDHYRQ